MNTDSKSKNTEPMIRNISDTARWVAFYRAIESERPDALFHDPYARKLAGERGERIARSLRGGLRNSWSMVVRTAVIDELLVRTLQMGPVDMVLNLAAGLDARPYRLDLSAKLRWVEVDLPEMISYKTEMLAGEQPRCGLERVALDLSGRNARRELFARLNAEAQHVVIISEGLLAYLEPSEVESLARDLHEAAHFQFWLTDVASPRVKKMMEKHWGKHLQNANAPIKFAPAEGEKFFAPFGWNAVEFREFLLESQRLNRTMPMMWFLKLNMRLFPKRTAKNLQQWRSGVALMKRA